MQQGQAATQQVITFRYHRGIANGQADLVHTVQVMASSRPGAWLVSLSVDGLEIECVKRYVLHAQDKEPMQGSSLDAPKKPWRSVDKHDQNHIAKAHMPQLLFKYTKNNPELSCTPSNATMLGMGLDWHARSVRLCCKAACMRLMRHACGLR